ncbi:hypothetical protein trd_0934 [Thermomicrobium roseum DSM 5159]|uniref:Uncharacterized protein n=1 Tax=Thermomicrobium roseum (strain ATCC 27502 / DSM 5159 / P-2) TaxID=309801 RepID=B9KZT9_THERP|nr:hypothetical protein trd_0934 [Thermomicrobium roseum DSM 5159]
MRVRVPLPAPRQDAEIDRSVAAAVAVVGYRVNGVEVVSENVFDDQLRLHPRKHLAR